MKLKYFRLVPLLVMTVFIQKVASAGVLPGPLIETRWLMENQGKVVILDVRKDVKSFEKKPVYFKDKKTGKEKLVKIGGHIAGSSLVNYGKVRGNKVVNGNKLEGMLPEKYVFESLMQQAGVNKNSAIVIVSKGENSLDMTMATRLYWTLKYFGHDDMAILNGGVAQWILDGGKVTSTAGKVKKGNWIVQAERNEILASSEDLARSGVQLVDNRPLSQYMGTYKKSYVYAKGHIPGAKSFPNELMTNPSIPARFVPRNELEQMLSSMGVDKGKNSVTYCNSGHLATGGWFIMSEVLGNRQVKLYDGSMHQWTREKRPVKAMVLE